MFRCATTAECTWHGMQFRRLPFVLSLCATRHTTTGFTPTVQMEKPQSTSLRSICARFAFWCVFAFFAWLFCLLARFRLLCWHVFTHYMQLLCLISGVSSLYMRLFCLLALLHLLCAVALRIGASSPTLCGCSAYWCVFACSLVCLYCAVVLLVGSLYAIVFCLAVHVRPVCVCFAYWSIFAYYVRLFCLLVCLHLRCGCFACWHSFDHHSLVVCLRSICNFCAYWCVFASGCFAYWCVFAPYVRLFSLSVRLRLLRAVVLLHPVHPTVGFKLGVGGSGADRCEGTRRVHITRTQMLYRKAWRKGYNSESRRGQVVRTSCR